ncbi:MAG: response regulator [Oligoflexia bacterium]|nr:response regulator [Oligoflexia bacterium]
MQQQFDESQRLNRFFSKLLQEVLLSRADKVVLTPKDPNLEVSILKGKDALKTVNIKVEWYRSILAFLGERQAIVVGERSPEAYRVPYDNGVFHCWSAVCLHDKVVLLEGETFRKVGKESLQLGNFAVLSPAEARAQLGLSNSEQRSLDDWMRLDSGVLLVSNPLPQQRAWAHATIQSVTGIPCVGDLSDPALRQWLQSIDPPALVAATVRADNAVDALLKARELGASARALKIRASWCLGFVPRLCPHCARKTPVDRNLLAELPPALVSPNWDSYLVGRGCAQCGERGTSGFVGVNSLCSVDDDVLCKLDAGAGEADLVRMLYPRGTRALVEDGLAKVNDGQTTLRGILSLSKTVSPAFLEALAKAGSTSPLTSYVHELVDPIQSKENGQQRNKPLLLVVEDDLDQRAILEMVFKAADYDVVVAQHGVEGLKVAEDAKPDLIVADLMMPLMDGAEFVKRLKADAALARIPVLVLTVVADGDREYQLLDLGAEDYCQKTIQRKLLLKRIEALLRRSRGAGVAR